MRLSPDSIRIPTVSVPLHDQVLTPTPLAGRGVAESGDPDSRTYNLKLVRGEPAGAPNPGIEEAVSDRELEVPSPEVTKAQHSKSQLDGLPIKCRLSLENPLLLGAHQAP